MSTSTCGPQPGKRTARRGISTVVLILFTLAACAWGALSLWSQAQQQFSPSPVDLARQANRLRWLELWGKLWPLLSVVLAGLLVLFLIALAWTLLRWLAERATAQYADGRGLFPIKALRAWQWIRIARWLWLPAQAVVYHDPNRAASPTTIYTPTLDGSAVAVRQVGAEGISPEQLRVTQGAQLAQIAAAVASGPGSTPAMRQQVGQRLKLAEFVPAVNIYNDLDRPSLIAPQLPPTQIIEGSHIERLLREQGRLPDDGLFPEEGDADAAPTR
ncbi:MAG: hypothetical protein JW934_19430 [Anaerolineae bacterium]|nr:hypothetical protein [Anaerolineae bacterium]